MRWVGRFYSFLSLNHRKTKAFLYFSCVFHAFCYTCFLNGLLLPYWLQLFSSFFLFTVRTSAVWQLIDVCKIYTHQKYIYRKKALMFSVMHLIVTKSVFQVWVQVSSTFSCAFNYDDLANMGHIHQSRQIFKR